MNERISSLLEKGEELRFVSKTEDFVFLDRTNKAPFIRKLVITLLVTLVLTILYIVKTVQINNMKPAIAIFLVVMGGYISISDLISAKKLKDLSYAVTSERLIILTDPEKSIPYSKIRDFEFKTDDDGHISLLIGADGINLPAKKWRMMTLSPMDLSEDGNEVRKCIFYAVSDPKKFEKAFREAFAAK